MLDMDRSADFGPETQGNSIAALRRLWSEGGPITIAVNGKVHSIRDDQTFERLVDLVDRIETIEGIREGLESMRRGEGRPAGEFFEELEREARTPRTS